MAKEQFFHSATQPIFKKLEQLSHRSGVSRAAAFEDWLTAMVCALAAETKEEEYLAMVARHSDGKPGHKGIDLMGQMFGELVAAMNETGADILGDLFQGSISYGEAGQYFTPESLTKLMSQMTVDPDARPENGKPIYVNDPCCGTGRMLLDAATINPHVELVGQDVDPRCARMTAINLGLRGRYGWVVCGNSLTCDTSFAYRVGSFFNETPNGLRRGVIRDVPPEHTPVPVIAARTRDQAGNLFGAEQEKPIATSGAVMMPTIIEIPRWLTRLESTLANYPSDERRPDTSPSSHEDGANAANGASQNFPSPTDSATPLSQRRLFE